MTTETFRARWIAQDGTIARDERFEYDVETHESFAWIRESARVALALDAPYFELREVQAHVRGYIETALVAEDAFVIVNEDGHNLGMRMVQHPLVYTASARAGDVFVGPIVLVERVA